MLADVVAGGDRLASLRALRDRLAESLDETESARDVATLSARLADVLEQIEACERAQVKPKGTPLDELRARREGKAAPSGASRAARGV